MSSAGTTQNTLVAYWSLDKKQNSTADTELWTNPEVSFSDDNRQAVADKDFAVGGKYYCKNIVLSFFIYIWVLTSQSDCQTLHTVRESDGQFHKLGYGHWLDD